MNPCEFVYEVATISFSDTFNPYADCCPIHDHKDAPARRREALLKIIEAACVLDVDAIWIGRDLGYRGGRRTGLALTDDVHIDAHARRWGTTISRPTVGSPMAERTAKFIWSILGKIEEPVFLWNVFPLHPHRPDNSFSNRSHNARERETGEGVLRDLVDLVQPRRLVAIGNDAHKSAKRICSKRPVIQVRHPSYGGNVKFLESIHDLYNASKVPEQVASLDSE